MFSLALEGGWLRRSLSAKLSATFGRPVEVAHFGFSILSGPEFEADSVTVAEDPRFGEEYFLRSDRLAAHLRWSALLHGRIEFDRLWLSHPSLNLVRASDGQWNIETWLPPPTAQTSLASHRPRDEAPAHLSRMDVEAGRINFKRGAEKLPFALLDLSGSITLQTAGRWSLDLQARPMRAAVPLQSPGVLHVQGTIGGTSARLQPADLRLNWSGASLADAARLVRGRDYGVRGLMDADFAAHIDRRAPGHDAGSDWKIDGGVRLQAVHRWDLVARADNPALNARFSATWDPAASRVQLEHWQVETPHSNLGGEASAEWSHGFSPELQVSESHIGLPDLVNWARAFSSAIANDLDIGGALDLDAKLSGWPLRIDDVTVEGNGPTLRSGGKLLPLRIGPLKANWSHSSLVLEPVAVRLSPSLPSRATAAAEANPAGAFYLEGSLGPLHSGDKLRDWPYRLMVSGETESLQDLRATLSALGWQIAPGWNAQGSAALQLVSTGTLRAGNSLANGELSLRNLRLSGSSFTEPVLVSTATVAFSPRERRVQLGGVEALGARWDGTLRKKAGNANWTFDLSADHLAIGELARQLGQSHEGLLYRFLPFTGSSGMSGKLESSIARISANGRLHVDELALAALRLQSVDATADLQHGALTLRQAEADLYGGRLSGEFRAQLGKEPRYSFRGQFDRADLAALAAITSFKNRISGTGSGELDLSARGIGRASLLASLEGEGFLHVQDALLDLSNSVSNPADVDFQQLAGSRFRTSTVSFRVQGGEVQVDPWLLSARQKQLEIVGTIDFTRNLNLQVRSIDSAQRPSIAPDSESSAADDLWIVGGTLDAPQIVRDTRVAAGNQTLARTGRR